MDRDDDDFLKVNANADYMAERLAEMIRSRTLARRVISLVRRQGPMLSIVKVEALPNGLVEALKKGAKLEAFGAAPSTLRATVGITPRLPPCLSALVLCKQA